MLLFFGKNSTAQKSLSKCRTFVRVLILLTTKIINLSRSENRKVRNENKLQLLPLATALAAPLNPRLGKSTFHEIPGDHFSA